MVDNEEMASLVESIYTQGILTPITVRPLDNGEYEIVSGHRRVFACKMLKMTEIPAIIMDYDRDQAVLAMVDSNLHREKILPSEKAFAYKLKYDALKSQGKRTDLTLRQIVPKSDSNRTLSVIGESMGDGYKTVERYIRLTNLIPELLNMMDEDKIALSVGVELSFLDEQMQYDLLRVIEELDCTPSYSQAWHMHRDFNEGTLTIESMENTLASEKPNQKPMCKVPIEKLQKIAPKVKDKDFEDFVLKACEHYYKYLQRQRSRDRDAR